MSHDSAVLTCIRGFFQISMHIIGYVLACPTLNNKLLMTGAVLSQTPLALSTEPFTY